MKRTDKGRHWRCPNNRKLRRPYVHCPFGLCMYVCMYVRLCTCSLERSCAGRNLRSLLRPNGQGAGKSLGNQANTEGLLMCVHMSICMSVPGSLSEPNGGASPVRDASTGRSFSEPIVFYCMLLYSILFYCILLYVFFCMYSIAF